MRILTWNVNGLGARVRGGDFEQLKAIEQPDVMCFQEIKTKEKLLVSKEYYHYWCPAENKKYSGTLSISLVRPQQVIYGMGNPELDKEGRVLTLDMGSVYVVNTYAPRAQEHPEREEYRRDWDEAYRAFLLELAYVKPVIACGDYNVTLSRIDIYKENERMDWAEAGYMSEERERMLKLIGDGFTDAFRYLYPYREGAYTWWSNRRNKRKEDRGWRLDYFLVSDVLQLDIRDVEIRSEIKGSDHCPMVLDIFIDDEAYALELAKALDENEIRKREDHHLQQTWVNRERMFAKYERKLAEMQSEITAQTILKNYEQVRVLQDRLMDDGRFKCLAVNKVAKASAPPGVDDVKWKTNADKMRAVYELDRRTFQASPRRDIEINNKVTGKVRISGILTYKDKAMATLCCFAFAPVEEAYADKSSFAFRPGRSRQDAIMTMAHLFEGYEAPRYFLYVDIKGFYAALQHKWIKKHVPLDKNVLSSFLSAGHIFEGELFPGETTGISEGSPLSPMIANYTLDGLQKAIYTGIHGRYNNVDYFDGAMARYADDVVVAVRSGESGMLALAAIKKFLKPRGLIVSEEKTKFGRIYDGLEVIGFHMIKEEYGIVVRPRAEAIDRFKTNMHDFIINHRGSQRELITKLNKKLMGWAGQYRFCDAYDSYKAVDAAVQASLLEAVQILHPKMQRAKLIAQYWYYDERGEKWYALPKEKDVRVIHLVDTLLVTPHRMRTDINFYLQPQEMEAKKQYEDMQRINAKYRSVWERYEGKCIYCGRRILPDHEKMLVIVDHTKKDRLWNKAYVHKSCTLDDYQFMLTTEDTGGMTEYDVIESLERMNKTGTVVLDKRIDEDWKYVKLYEYFAGCTTPKVMLSFKQIEDILGFELSDAMKTNRHSWYPRKSLRTIADAWTMQGYKLKTLYLKNQKVKFEAMFEDAEHVVIPPEIMDRKLPRPAKYEIEHFLKAMVKKYALGEEVRKSNKKPVV